MNLLMQYLIPVLYTVLFYFVQIEPRDGSYWQVIMLLGGFYVGNLFLWLDDKVLYGQYNELQTLPKRLVSRSILFLLVYVALSIFMVTSVGNVFGVGIILGIGLSLSIEMWRARDTIEQFHQQFLYQVKRQLSPLEVQRIAVGFLIYVSVIALYYLFTASR
jgi:hypothetical protein